MLGALVVSCGGCYWQSSLFRPMATSDRCRIWGMIATADASNKADLTPSVAGVHRWFTAHSMTYHHEVSGWCRAFRCHTNASLTGTIIVIHELATRLTFARCIVDPISGILSAVRETLRRTATRTHFQTHSE